MGFDVLTTPELEVSWIRCSFTSLSFSKILLYDQVCVFVGDKDSSNYPDPPMLIKVVINEISSLTFDDNVMELEIDKFLTLRPWWKLAHDSGGHALGTTFNYLL